MEVVKVNEENSAEDAEINQENETQEPESALMIEIRKNYEENSSKFGTLSQPLISFLIGAILGAQIVKEANFWCMSVPVAILVSIVIALIMK